MNREQTDLDIPIRTLEEPGPGLVHRAVATLVTAFAADPFARYWYAGPAEYLEVFPEAVRAFGGQAFRHGTADLVEADDAGAALWLPPGVRPDNEAIVSLIEEVVTGEKRSELLPVALQTEAHRPKEKHWHLTLIGVDPARQGRGLGSALLRHGLRRCDRQGAPAHLEATSPRNISLYERHGFRVTGEIQAGASPPVYAMRREPGG